jgi:hypothetical protein
MMRLPVTPRFLRTLAVVYAVKTLLVGIAWLAIPDLPERAATHVRETWQRLAGDR